ncbi:MAG TPA: 16S rRNA (cytosine(1402)-N(4))-methyltransferase RsmH, partial [Caldithrix abyssi]|nr:16S rRNA (cytosine(1402)-N(4))-methyltransferase RsmH [Caldithrix abyssi]
KLRHFANIRLVHREFDETEDILRQAEVEKVDGVLLDLGVSSHQIDADERGFAFRPGVALDMRMDRGQSFTAADILAKYSERELTRVFREYGEERFARRIANKIVAARAKQPLALSDQLLEIIRQSVPGQMVVKSYARIFQALRIEVNQELERLKNALHGWLEHLNPGGRMVVISYHSLEDRIVKQFFKEQENPCICPPEFPVCVCGRKPQIRRIRPFLIRPEEDEIKDNPRARSAKMRVGEKL